MSITRDPNSFSHLVEWTEEINEVDNQFGYLNAKGIFDMRPTSQNSVLFDRNINTITLLPDADRATRQGSFGKDREVDTFALPLAKFKHSDFITNEDIQGQRRPGDQGVEESLERVRAEKLSDLRLAVDQTKEYMKIQAIKGKTITPSGTVLADMPTLFGLAGNDVKEIDFVLGTAATEIDNKISELKRHIATNLKGAGPLQGIEVLVDPTFFDKLISHAKMKEIYLNSTSNVRYQEDMSKYMQWGIMDSFTVRGVTFLSYDAVFNMPDGTTEVAIAANQGHAIPVARGMFRGYNGPSDKLSAANSPGQDMFAYEFRDPRDENHEMQVQAAPLMFATKPGALVRVITSN